MLELARDFPHVHAIDGSLLFPAIPEITADGLHPNDLGFQIYGKRFIEQLSAPEFAAPLKEIGIHIHGLQ